MPIHRPIFLNFLKVVGLFLIGYILASHYRPFQNNYEFFDFGLADSGVGLISIVALYYILTPPFKNQVEANNTALLVLFVYISQEVFCFFLPGPLGTFDFIDLIYYIIGYKLIYMTDVKFRQVI